MIKLLKNVVAFIFIAGVSSAIGQQITGGGSGGGCSANCTITESIGSSALTLTGATQTSSFPVITATQTWNNAGTTFTGWKLNVTNSASASASLLADLQVGAASKFSVREDGLLVVANGITSNGNGVSTCSTCTFSWNGDLFLGRNAANSVRLGFQDGATASDQTFTAQGITAGGATNTIGGNLTLRPGNGTGNASPSSLILQSPVAVASGTGAQTQTTGLTIKGGQMVSTGYAVASLPTGITGGRAHVTDQLTACPALGGTFTGGGAVVCPAFYNGAAWVNQ